LRNSFLEFSSDDGIERTLHEEAGLPVVSAMVAMQVSVQVQGHLHGRYPAIENA
jgi:predicted HD phosphohydrolase